MIKKTNKTFNNIVDGVSNNGYNSFSQTGNEDYERIVKSSDRGTGGEHNISDINIFNSNFNDTYNSNYGDTSNIF